MPHCRLRPGVPCGIICKKVKGVSGMTNNEIIKERPNIIGRRISDSRKQKGLKQTELAEMIGVSVDSVRRWEQGKREPRASELEKIADILDTSVVYLLGGNEKAYMPGDEPFSTQKQPIESNVATMNDAIMIPVVTDDISACCGGGNIYPDEVKWEIVGYYPMDSSDLIGYTWQTNDFCVIKVNGDSMEPHFNDGERVLFVKAPDIQVTSGDFAVMLYQGKLLIRGIIFEKDGKIILKPTNDKYKDIIIAKNSGDLCVLGKILGVVPAYRKTPGLW
jgi:transcriptional regulator with XRE-family HTH domain